MPNFAALQAIDQSLPGNAPPPPVAAADPYADVIDVGGASPAAPAPTPPAAGNAPIVVPRDSPLTQYAGQTLHIAGPESLPPGITLPATARYPIRLNFGDVAQPATFSVVTEPAAVPASAVAPPPAVPVAVPVPASAPASPQADPLAKFRVADAAFRAAATAPAANAASPAEPSPSAAPAYAPTQFDNATAQAIHAMTFGADQVVQPAIGATVDAGMRLVQGMPQAWQDDYSRLQQKQLDELAQFHAEHPIEAAASGLAGGLASAGYAAPLFGAAPEGAGLVGQAANYGRNIAAGAGTGFGSGFGLGQGGVDQRLQSGIHGAEFGAALPAAIPAIAAIAAPALSAAGTVAGKVLSAPARILSSGAQAQSVGDTLGREVSPAAVETSPVGPLDLAQATNNPAIAAKVQYAEGSVPEASAAASNIRAAQRGAVQQQIGKIGPAATTADASAVFTNTLRQARQVAGGEENRLWTVPELAKEPVTVAPVQSAVRHAVADMDPEFAANMSPQLKGIVSRLNRAGPTTIRDLNTYRSQLEKIARTSLDGAERNQARTLSDAFMEGMDQIPEVAGKAAGPTSQVTLSKDAQGNTVSTPVMSPEVKPNPALVKAYQDARTYTRTMRTMFDAQDAAQLLRKVQGVYTKDPSEGAKLFFNLSNGSPEGPQTIAQLADFVDGLKEQPSAGPLAEKLRDSARSYFAAALSDASKLGEGQKFSPAAMQTLLRKNLPWIKSSGLFEPPQVKAASDLLDYADMLRRPEMLKVQGNSPTNRLGEIGKTFISQIMTPWMRRIAELGVAGIGAAHSGALGGALGAGAGMAFEHAVLSAETAMRTLMANAVLDSRVASDLLRSAKTTPAALTPKTRALLKELVAQVGAEQAGQITGGAPSKETTNSRQAVMQ